MSNWPERFPPFLWGAATSSHQIEGHQENDWTAFERTGAIAPSGQALDHWNRYRADFGLLKDLGLTSYRFSIEWSRVEPQPNQFDEAALRQYRDMVLLLRQQGITPLVTLHHFTLPQWVSQQGGFLHPSAINWFCRYILRVLDYIGNEVFFYVTINEPMVLVVLGYLIAIWPPQRRGFRRALRLVARLAEAHRAAYETIKAHRPQAMVGMAHHLIAFHPWHQGSLDGTMTRWVRYLMNDRFIHMVEPYQDFIGVNYYTRQYIRFWSGLHPIQSRPENPQSSLGWEIYPQGLMEVLTPLSAYQKPILITENGIATQDDAIRTAFLRDHLRIIQAAQQNDLRIRGYFHWSAFDNFEWAEGYAPRFGLIHVNYDTLERTIRPSGHYYKHVIGQNRHRYPIIVP